MEAITEGGANVLDSRDVIQRLQALGELRADLLQKATDLKNRQRELSNEPALTSAEVTELDSVDDAVEDIWTTEEGDDLAYSPEYGEDKESEFQALKALDEEGRLMFGESWTSGKALISEDHWSEYVVQMCQDIGDIARESWLIDYVDWDAAEDALLADYKSLDYGDTTYYGRS